MDLMPFHGPPAAAPRVPGFIARTLLGFGTHGEVWLADDLSSGGTVALKIGRRALDEPSFASGDPPDRHPEHETALLCRIDHPHIVRLQRVVPLPAGGLAMVLDLASGGSLASLVAARGRFDPGEVSTLLVPLADALGHLHRQGVVHGDIAPGNVLFTGEGRPQLGDLGAARLLGSRVGEAWATPGFTDPVLLRPGPDNLDLRATDLWGLAAVGWFALTGRPPEPAFEGSPVTDRAPALGELLAQCLTAEPADRPSLQELADRAWQAAHPTPVRLVSGRDPELGESGLPPLSHRATRKVPVVSGIPPDDDSVDHGSPDAGSSGAGSSMGGPAAGAQPRDGSGSASSWDQPGIARIRAERRFRGTVARRRARVIALVAVGTAVAAVGAAVTVRPQASGESGLPTEATPGVPLSVRSVGSGNESAATDTPDVGASAPIGPGDPPATADLEAELTQALIAIGRSRAAAFGHVSAGFLAKADVTGSPAYTEDVRLVQRLRSQGYRLQGVRYQVSGVEILHRRGDLVDVRAMVTTSAHQQVRIRSGVRTPVPVDGPRAIVFTVAPVDLNISGPERWRVRSVQVSS
ncbi:MAG TPA: serine/threonine-protein kinase [Kineosporiaceae bacterium]|nr:serine/threonine-protein kinase [Kineosporiaceae bacterium]